MNKGDTKKLFESVYGTADPNDFKNETEMKSSSSKRGPAATFEDGDEIEFPADVLVKSESSKIGGVDRTFDTTAVMLKRGSTKRPMKFFLSWISNPPFTCLMSNEDEQTLKDAIANNELPESPQDGTNSSNEGDLVSLWQSVPTQFEAVKKVANKKYKVTIVGYYISQFSPDRVRPRFSFDEK